MQDEVEAIKFTFIKVDEKNWKKTLIVNKQTRQEHLAENLQ